ncbi:uncharacterized protein LOC132793702 [Drosophila nasuta]|uniref:uncharacterized protein LOC132793702 n=1 Tax=Drosophila nasuta TaxID=42062 RepID=UPI00295ED238|nr:uncharacterized protein LOC132793702 [Drosophila nasuta]
MPNFNGAIIMHTLQMIKTPATLREIVVAIAKNTDLPEEDLMKPVKQTLDVGNRMGFLQKLNGRYFMVSMTFDTLLDEIKSLNETNKFDFKLDLKPKTEKRTIKKSLKQLDANKKSILQKTQLDNEATSTTTLIPPQLLKAEALLRRKPKRANLPIK